jgi:hypothetical protein
MKERSFLESWKEVSDYLIRLDPGNPDTALVKNYADTIEKMKK